jgi:hypothetical protein
MALYAILKETSKAIAYAPHQDTLYHQICHIAVACCGFYGSVGAAGELVVPIAEAGMLLNGWPHFFNHDGFWTYTFTWPPRATRFQTPLPYSLYCKFG